MGKTIERPKKHVMKVLTAKEGDRKIEWDKGKKEDVESARADFDHYTGLGYKAFVLDDGDQKGKQIDKFDPNVERMILIPQMRGGSQ